MNNLSPEQILKIQIKLLQSSGKTLTTLHKHLLLSSTQKEIKLFKQFDKRKLSQKMKKMFVANIQSMGDDPNANFRVFSIIILKLIYTKQINQDILQIIKSHLHNENTILTKIQHLPKNGSYSDISNLTNVQMKKILVEFFHMLKYSFSQYKIQDQVKKHPLALQLMVIFFRQVLLYFKVPQAQNYCKKISTTASYQILFQFLDIFYNKSGNLYLLRDDNLFIQNGHQNQNKQFIEEITYGNYYLNEEQYQTAILKNMQNPILYDSQSSKITSPFNSGQFNCGQFNVQVKCDTTQKINPFQLMVPPTNPKKLSDSNHSKKSNKSMNSSNGFDSKRYNLGSNRSQASINLDDSQCDNPTPQFNQYTEDQLMTCFIPADQPSISTINHRSTRATNATNTFLNMKQSATIMPSRSKILKSSLFQDTREECPKGSLQLQRQTIDMLGLQNKGGLAALDTTDSPIDPKISFNSLQNVFEFSNRQRQQTQTYNVKQFKSSQNDNNEQDKRMMKRSQSQKNSFIKNQESGQYKVSLFGINCKKLKTSIQMDDTVFFSQKNIHHLNLNDKHFKQLCQHSNYSCSCNSLKIQKNSLCPKQIQFCYKPNNFDFKKKGKQTAQFFENAYNMQINPQKKTKIQDKISNLIPNLNKSKKLDDDFFKKLRIKRQQQKNSNQNPKNRSQQKNSNNKEEKKNVNDRTFIKFSQFIKPSQRSVSKSPDKTPNKAKRNFPLNFKKIQSFFTETKQKFKQQTPKKLSPNNDTTQKMRITPIKRALTPTKFNSKSISPTKKYQKPPQLQVTFISKYQTPYSISSPCTPSIIQKSMQTNGQFLGVNKINLFSGNGSNVSSVSSQNKQIIKGPFSPKSSTGFGKNDQLFYNPTVRFNIKQSKK